ncbi:MAG TPA: hypothetical protein VFW19_06370 [Allosphingosinicella sp.]|nr:hypothetical protein [Allosphingosinicella sp.]
MLFAALLLALAAPPPSDDAPSPSSHVQELLRQTDGSTRERAFKVGSVPEEYQIVRALGLRPKSQSLVSDHGHMYDLLTVTDPKTGGERALWFDIDSFYGKEF